MSKQQLEEAEQLGKELKDVFEREAWRQSFKFDMDNDELVRALEQSVLFVRSSSPSHRVANEKLLHRSFDAAQLTLPPFTADTTHLKQWPAGHSVTDALGELDAGQQYDDAFMVMRRIYTALASAFDKGVTNAIVQDLSQERSAVNIRILKAYRLPTGTPLLALLYSGALASDPQPAYRWINTPRRPNRSAGLVQIHATEEEQKLLFALLSHNAAKVEAPAKDALDKQKIKEEKVFDVSFFLPIAPLSEVALSALTLAPVCEICGEPASLRCSECRAARYCSAKCQKRDWKEHKPWCRLPTGPEAGRAAIERWQPLPFALHTTGAVGIPGVYFSHSTGPSDTPYVVRPDATAPPPNAHGPRMFVLHMKLGFEMLSAPSEVRVWDDKKALFGYIREEDCDSEVFGRLHDEFVNEGEKEITRMARRVGEWELCVGLRGRMQWREEECWEDEYDWSSDGEGGEWSGEEGDEDWEGEDVPTDQDGTSDEGELSDEYASEGGPEDEIASVEQK